MHLRTNPADVGQPVLLDDRHGPVAIYPIPYLEPDAVADELGCAERGHAAVVSAAMARVRADLAGRPNGTRSVAMAHVFATGGEPSESERDIVVGGLSTVPTSVFAGLDYAALGHLHGPQRLAEHVRYSGSPLPYSFSEERHRKSSWLVELGATGLERVDAVPTPVHRQLARLRGRLADLLADPGLARHEQSFLSITLTDPARPADAMRALRARFPYALLLAFEPDGQVDLGEEGYLHRLRGRTDLQIATGFVEFVRERAVDEWERTLLREAVHHANRERDAGRGLMRLHRLAVTAFGPFRDEQVVDFETLSATGLFLLTGDTGAGKTSVLDAVAYALYGRVAGSRASATRIRSDHADPDQPTTVTLELTLRGRRLRVIRAPEWHRRKVRGTGTTKQPTKVTLERFVDGQWELVSNRADEIGHELGELLGMNHQQFCQVVLLPQGDFAQFLRADAETRKRLLERLFGTERFSAVEGWLVERRRERGQALQHGEPRDRGNHRPARRGRPVTTIPRSPTSRPAVTAWAAATARLRRRGARRGGRHAGRCSRASHRSGPTTRRRACPRRAPRSADVADLTGGRARGRGPARRPGQARAGSRPAGRAGSPGCSLRSALPASARRPDALTRWPRSRRSGATPPAPRRPQPSPGSSDANPGAPVAAALERGRADVRAEIIRLEAMLGDEVRLVELSADLDAADVDVADLEADMASHDAWLTAAPARAAALHERRETLASLVRDLPAQRDEHAALGPSIEAARTRDRLVAELADAADRRRAAVDAAQHARQAWQDLRERRLAAMAGELAAGLVDGAPCPVCGGIEHPAPAASAAAAVEDAVRARTPRSTRSSAPSTRGTPPTSTTTRWPRRSRPPLLRRAEPTRPTHSRHGATP